MYEEEPKGLTEGMAYHWTADELIDHIRSAKTLKELTNLVGPSDEDERLSEERLEAIEILSPGNPERDRLQTIQDEYERKWH